jgi:hypothetical protein
MTDLLHTYCKLVPSLPFLLTLAWLKLGAENRGKLGVLIQSFFIVRISTYGKIQGFKCPLSSIISQ